MIDVLIVGANSILGQEIIFQEIIKGKYVLGIYNINKSRLNIDIEYKSIDVLFDLNISPKVIYFVSAYIPSRKDDNEKLFATNVRLLKKVSDHFSNSKIVLASTVSIYETSKKFIKENSKIKPLNTYAISKLWSECILQHHCNYSIVRISSMFGVGMNNSSFLLFIIESSLKKNYITLYGDGSRLQNYVHVSHVAKVMIAAANNGSNKMYLAVGNKSYTNKDMYYKLLKIDSSIKLKFQGDDNSTSSLYDDTCTKNELNINYDVNFNKELNKLWNWLKKS